MTLYLTAVLVFFIFFVAAGVVALVCNLLPSLRPRLPTALRIWGWGTIGFLSGYLVSWLILLIIPPAVRHATGKPLTVDEAGFILSVLIYLPPAIALVGGLVGAGVGYRNGTRYIARNSHSGG